MLKVLVAPLDWGLGHATRCIPIIKELVNQRCTVIIAASGAQKALLQKEFPTLRCIEIPAYQIRYGKNRAFTILRLMASIPKILIRIKRENQWLRRFAHFERPDLVLSDNRYGLHLKGVFCVFMTHQLLIRTSFGPVADRLLQRINYSLIDRFSICWVPDMPGDDNLAGELSHPSRMPVIPTRYIGWLSRLGGGGGREEGSELKGGSGGMGGSGLDGAKIEFDVLALLSGPEPQRTILEKMILEQAAGCNYKMALVRGLPGGGLPLNGIPGLLVHDHLPGGQLEELIRRSGVVLSRAGYSTVMDLMQLGKKAILIPTPGQTEQEYLGRYLAVKRLAVCVQQREFLLKEAVARAQELKDRPAVENGLLTHEIKAILSEAGG